MTDKLTRQPVRGIVPTTLNDIAALADFFAASRMFIDGCDDRETCKAKIVVRLMYGMELGLPPAAACTGVNIIKGRPTLGAGAIAAAIMGSGFIEYREVVTDDDKCSLDWYRRGKKVGNSTFTMSDARRAQLVKSGGNWSKYPRAMLFARALTEGQRRYCPDLFGGSIYTPDELKTEVVEVVPVSQPHPKASTPRPSPSSGDAITQAKRHLLGVVGTASKGQVDPTRVHMAIRAKIGKPNMATEADYREVAGIVRAFGEAGTLAEWCSLMLGDGEPPIEAEVIEPTPEQAHTPDLDERYRKGTLRAFHDTWEDYCAARDLSERGIERRIMADKVRQWSLLTPDSDWADVSLNALRKMTKFLQLDDGKAADIAIGTEWRQAAVERGVVELDA